MTLPTFIGIGAPRSGTTWLHKLLDSHPDVYMPTRRKEIRFFDQYYERGPDWYETLFPPAEHANKYKALGEISPQYLEYGKCPERIFTTLPESRLIVLLRHPVNRAYSQYGFFVQRRNFRGSFEDFLAERPRALKRGFYSRYLKRFLHFFDRSQILSLLFEDIFKDKIRTQQTIADFLEIATDKFPPSVANSKVNASSVPRFQFLYGFIAKTGQQFRKWRLEPVVDLFMRTNIHRILERGNSLPPLEKELKQRLSRSYKDEFDELEHCLQIDLSCWRN